jgi:CrcB protein
MNHLVQACLLAIAGAAGTLLRAGCTALAVRCFGHSFPWGTLAVNVLGSFAFGALYAFARSRSLVPGVEAVLLVGLLGGFTTYSTFAFQAAEMLQSGRTSTAVGYVAATNLVGLAAVWAGLRLGR